jgi:hypothetical protein
MLQYDENGDCIRCGLPGSGFVSDGVCMCEDEPWTDEDEAALEEYEERKRRRIAEANEY